MKKNKLFLASLIFFTCFEVFGQVGFQKKKNIFSASILANTPYFSGAFSGTHYMERSGKMEEGKERLNWGYSLLYVRQVKPGLGLGLEYNMKEYSVPSPLFYNSIVGSSSINKSVDSSFMRMEGIKIRSKSFHLRFEFSNKKGIAPAGIIHGLGIGYAESTILNKNYRYAINEFGNNIENEAYWTEIDNYYIFQNYPKTKAISLTYDLTYRRPLTNDLSFDIGIKYLFSIHTSPGEEELLNLKGHPIDFTQVYNDMKRENFMTINFKIGLSYML